LTPLILILAATPGLDALFDPFSDEFPRGGGRIAGKQAAFDEHLEKRGPGRMLRAMRRCEDAVGELREKSDDAHDRLLKARAKYRGWMEDYREKYRRREKRDPAHYPMPESLNKEYLDRELDVREANSLLMREMGFHRWAFDRLAEAAPHADGRQRALLEKELRARSPHQRLRAARLLRLVPGFEPAKHFERERHPAVAAELAPGAAALGHESWVARAGAIRVLRQRRERASVEALVARWPEETGRLRDDLHDALARLTGRVESDWPAWWKALPADWAPGPPPPRGKEERVVECLSPDDRRVFGLQTGSERLVLCLGAAAGWPAIREEALRFLGAAPERAEFGVVAFGAGAEAFRKSLAPNTGTNRKALAKWMEDRELGGRNDLWTGLDAAFDLTGKEGADTLVVVNPAPPTEVGESPAKLFRPRQILYALSHRNALLQVRVLAYGRSGGGDAYFLQELAREYGGGCIPLPSGR